MSVGDATRGWGRVFRILAFALLALVVMLTVSGLALRSRGESEMAKSDAAFHRGELRQSIVHARRAALSFVPGAAHVRSAYARLEAIARGAEAQGDKALARIAWDVLRVCVEQTDYPGRPESGFHSEALKNLERLEAAREEHESEI